jgi:type VI secretion system secreted protein VgrG
VVGASGDEICTDEFGRVKVQFDWDRNGERDQKAGCWVRVAQVWAGKQWGAMHIPRVGQEVIVEFLDGDPDRPIITGRVYNKDNMPPYELPKNKTQSGIKSRSSKDGTASNFNELRFEDLKGKEELHIQAEKDMSTLVKNNQSTSVGADRSVSVGGNHSVSVNGTQSTTVTKDETQTYKANRTMKVTGKNNDTVTDTHTATYDNTRTETVKAPDALTVNAGDKTITVHGKFDNTVDTEFKVTKGGTTMTITDDFVMSATGKMDLHNPGTSVIGEGTKLTLNAGAELTLTCGSSSISMKSDGTIEITGKTVKIGNATNNAAFEPAGTTINGVQITSSATGIHQISGALVKVG